MPFPRPLERFWPTQLGDIAAPQRIERFRMVTIEDSGVRSVREGPVHSLTPFGELDIATAPILEREFYAVQPDPTAQVIVVDLTQLSFMDSAALHLLARLEAICEPSDRLRVIKGSPAAERIIDLSGMADRLPIISHGDDPLAPRQPRPSLLA
jgi:anti-anti-sigma factor